MTKILIFDTVDDVVDYADKLLLTVDWDNSCFLDGKELFYFALVEEYSWYDTE